MSQKNIEQSVDDPQNRNEPSDSMHFLTPRDEITEQPQSRMTESDGDFDQFIRPSNHQDAGGFAGVEMGDDISVIRDENRFQTMMDVKPASPTANELAFENQQPQQVSVDKLISERPARVVQSTYLKGGLGKAPQMAQHQFVAVASQRKVVIGSRYAEALKIFDQTRGHDQLVNYFCTIGMEDADIVHTVMSVKEMISTGYQLNGSLHDDLVSNEGILSGDRKFFSDPQIPRYHVPIFQPKILSRVPSIDRSKLLFPINLADFAFPDGVQVISATEVLKRKQSHIEKYSRPQYKCSAWLDSLPIPALEARYDKDTGRHDSGIERHLMLTNQEGKQYYATCYDYFVDLRHLTNELEQMGHFDQYRNFKKEQSAEVDSKQRKINNILEMEIPPARYYLQFTMCIVSQKSFKMQFYRMLDRVYYAYVTGEISQDGKQQSGLTLEEIVNRIVFRIPNPPKRLDYLTFSCQSCGPLPFSSTQKLIKVVLSENAEDAVYFQNESPFDVNYSELGNICVLLCRLPSENVIQLFKRLLFNTCTILQSDDIKTVDRCIQGIMQLFYPLNCSITCVPNLPENTLEYISQCSQSVIGVVRNRTKKIGMAKIKQNQENDEFGTSLTSSELQQRVANELNKNEKSSKKSHTHEPMDMRSIEFNPEMIQSGRASFLDFESSKRSLPMQERQKSNFIELFDIMQDNSCLIAMNREHPIQKPKQAVCFNSKGRLSHGQGAANRGQNFRGQTATGRVAYGGRPAGNPETLNDIDLPRQHVTLIRQAIQKVQKTRLASLSKIEQEISTIRALQEQPDNIETQQALFKTHSQLHQTLWPLLLQVRDVKLALYEMVKEILQFYIKPELIKDFKGSNTKSGHMPNYLYWQMSMDIFSLINRQQFKILREPENALSTFYVKLVLYPSIQNFLCDKYFPQSEEDNLRQLCALPESQFQPYIPKSHKHREEAQERDRVQMMYMDDRGVLEVVNLFDDRSRSSNQAENNSASRQRSALEQQIIEEDTFARDVSESIYQRSQTQQSKKFYQEKRFFPRHLNEVALRKDFHESHFKAVKTRKVSKPEEILRKTFENLGVSHHLAPVYELNYRLANHFERRNPRVDIIVAWLLLFVSSLDYQLDPFTIAELSDPTGGFLSSQQHFRPPAYYKCQTKLEQLLSKYFEKSMTQLIHKGDYDFNPKCPLLSLLFEHTHPHHSLHQKLLQIVHQDIDQMQSAGAATTGMTVSASFALYQLHWDSKQVALRRSRRDAKRLKERTQIDALSAKLDELSYGQTRGELYTKLKQVLKDAKRVLQQGQDLQVHDPYVLNQQVDEEWQYLEARQRLLEMLAEEDQILDDLNKNNRDVFEIQHKKFAAQSNGMGLEHAIQKEKKPGFKKKLSRLLSGKQTAIHKAHAEQLRLDKNLQAFKKVQQRLEKLQVLHKSLIDQTMRQQTVSSRESQLFASQEVEQQSVLRQNVDGINILNIREKEMSFERSQSQIEKARSERKKKSEKLFEDLLQRPRSFFSLNQLRNARKIKDGKFEMRENMTDEELQSSRMKVRLNLVNLKCTNCEEQGTTPTLSMDGIIHKLKCKTCNKEDVVRGMIQVLMYGDLGSYEIVRVRLYGPKKMRSEVESLLKVDRFYKTLQKIDLSAFSQAQKEIELYWNAIFWFQQQDLHYLWLCPYTSHLGDFAYKYSEKSKSRHNQHSSRSRTKSHKPFEVESANPKRSIFQKLFEFHTLIMKDSEDKFNQIIAADDEMPILDEDAMGGGRSTMAESLDQPQDQLHKEVVDMTVDEKMRAAEKMFLKRQKHRIAKRANDMINQL